MKTLTPRDRSDLEEFKSTTGLEPLLLGRYLSGEWEWYEFWDYNFSRIKITHSGCRCKVEALRVSGRRKGYPLGIADLERLGFEFEHISGDSCYADAYYKCSCGQNWKEVFYEAMQYNGNHAYPIDDDALPPSSS